MGIKAEGNNEEFINQPRVKLVVDKIIAVEKSEGRNLTFEELEKMYWKIVNAHALVTEVDGTRGGLDGDHTGHILSELPDRYRQAKALLDKYGITSI